MSEENDSGRFNKSSFVLGDVTNRICKRGFSEREKRYVKSYNLNDKHTVKHVRVLPRQCTDLDLLKGDVLSRISKVSPENNKGLSLNVQDLESGCAFSERSIDTEAELKCDYGNSVEINGKNAVKLSEKKAESPNVNPMFAVDNGSVNTLGDIALRMWDKIGRRNSKDHKEIPNAVPENTSPNLTGTVKSNVVDVARSSSSGDIASSITKISKSSYVNLLDLGRGNAFRCANIKAKYKSGDIASANTSSTVSETGTDCLLDFINCDAGEAKVSLEGTQNNLVDYLNEIEGHNADNLIMSQTDSIDCAILLDSQESRVFGVEKSFEPNKGEGYLFFGGGVDAIKTCSCSFCTKAAYIWLDLNYQDIRGRVLAIRKRQKVASILAEKSRMTKETEKHNAEGSTRISKMETDLMQQWKFLFQQMSGILEHEGDCLETSLSPLTDLREKCKRDLGSG